jgi:hypothetical protein
LRRPPSDPEVSRRKLRERARRAALRALRRAKAAAAAAGVSLTEWEDVFLGSVEARVQTYGRAFADPEKGGGGSALSTLQRRALRQIGAKAREAASRSAEPDPESGPDRGERSAPKGRPERPGEGLRKTKPLGSSKPGRAIRRQPPPRRLDP